MPSRYPGKPGRCSNCGRYTCISRKPEFPTHQRRCVGDDASYDTHCAVCCPEQESTTPEILRSVREKTESRLLKRATKALESLVS